MAGFGMLMSVYSHRRTPSRWLPPLLTTRLVR